MHRRMGGVPSRRQPWAGPQPDKVPGAWVQPPPGGRRELDRSEDLTSRPHRRLASGSTHPRPRPLRLRPSRSSLGSSSRRGNASAARPALRACARRSAQFSVSPQRQPHRGACARGSARNSARHSADAEGAGSSSRASLAAGVSTPSGGLPRPSASAAPARCGALALRFGRTLALLHTDIVDQAVEDAWPRTGRTLGVSVVLKIVGLAGSRARPVVGGQLGTQLATAQVKLGHRSNKREAQRALAVQFCRQSRSVAKDAQS